MQRNLVTHLLRKAERAHATSLHRAQRLQSSSSTCCNFWDFVKGIRGSATITILPDLINPSDSLVAGTPLKKAELLNSFFKQQTVLPGEDAAEPDVQPLRTNDDSFVPSLQLRVRFMTLWRHLKSERLRVWMTFRLVF